MKKIVDRFKNRVQNFKINFKKKFKESKEKPKSKRKSFILGLTTAVAIFGFTLFGPALSAVAKDLTKGSPKPTDIAPAPSAPPSNEILNTGLSGLAASVCSLAVTSGSFAVGVACGFIVVIGILHLEGR
jgi:MFS family permease